MALSVAIVLWQIVSRYGLGEPSSATDELVRYLLVWIGLFGSAHAALHRHHLAIDLLPRRLRGRRLQLQQIAVEAAIGLFATAVMVGGGLRLVSMAAELGQRSAALELPLGWLYLALPAAGALIALDAGLAAVGWLRPAKASLK